MSITIQMVMMFHIGMFLAIITILTMPGDILKPDVMQAVDPSMYIRILLLRNQRPISLIGLS